MYMKKGKGLALFALLGAVLLFSFPAADAASASFTKPDGSTVVFDDLDEWTWARDAVAQLVSLGVIDGVGNQKFAPDDTLTREQLAKLITVYFGLVDTGREGTYNDVKFDAWSYEYIEACKEYLTGYYAPTSTKPVFHPEQYATREEILVALGKIQGYLENQSDAEQLTQFSDYADVSVALRPIIGAVISNKIVTGYEDGTLRPQAYLNRAETVVLLSRMKSPPPPRITYINPKGQTEIDANFLTIKGQVDMTSYYLLVNGERFEVNISPEGEFVCNVPIDMSKGTQTLTVRAERKSMPSAFAEERIEVSISDDPIVISFTASPSSTTEESATITGRITTKKQQTFTARINGAVLPVDAQGYFSVSQKLNVGQNVFEVTAADALNKEAKNSINIERKEKEAVQSSFEITSQVPKTTTDGTLILRGKVSNMADNCTLLLNGKEIPLNANGVFESAVELSPGENSIGLKLYNGDSLSVEKTLEITREDPLAAVPNLIGKTSDEARRALEQLGLEAVVENQFDDDPQNEGRVIAQSENAGGKVAKGTAVRLVVSKGVSSWSDWVLSLPSNVSESGYAIEKKTESRHRRKETTTSPSSALAGWALVNSSETWGAWSDWMSIEHSLPVPPRTTSTTQVELAQWWNPHEPDVARYRNLIYTYTFERWGEWSVWSEDAVPNGAQSETRTVYRYKAK
jgi:hypothetical protein